MQRVSLAPSNQDYLLTPYVISSCPQYHLTRGSNPRLVAPTPSQVHLLRCRAEQAAVTWPDLGAPPSQAICPTRARRVESLRCTQATALPTIFFGVTSEETHVGYPGTSIPVLSVLPLESEGMVKRQRRRWRTKSLREWAQPQYWQPPPGLEGRSRGYAYGYG